MWGGEDVPFVFGLLWRCGNPICYRYTQIWSLLVG
jgi:hypothetical protein